MKVFNPLAKTSRNIENPYKHHENVKKLKYQQRVIEVEHSSFVPLIFSCSGGSAPAANKVMQRLAELISEKKNESYSDTMNYIRTKVSFALIRSAVLCIRGCRALKKQNEIDNSIGAIVEESRL